MDAEVKSALVPGAGKRRLQSEEALSAFVMRAPEGSISESAALLLQRERQPTLAP